MRGAGAIENLRGGGDDILYGDHRRISTDSGYDPAAKYLTAAAKELHKLLDANQQRALQVLDDLTGAELGALATHEFHPFLWSKSASLSLSSDLLSELATLDLVIASKRQIGVGKLDTWQISPIGRQVIGKLKGSDD